MMDLVQQIASRVVCRVMSGRSLKQELDAALRGSPLPPSERGALQDLCYGTLRFYSLLTNILTQLLHKPARNEHLRNLLLVAMYQLQYTKAAPYAVVDNAVRAARTFDAGAGGFVNALLRNFLRQRETLIAKAMESEESRHGHPQWWIDLLRAQYGERADAILQANNQHPPMTLRVNTRLGTPEDYLALLAQHGIEADLIEPGAVRLAHALSVQNLPGFLTGQISVQDAGAQYAALLLDVHDGMNVLDACAAPGSKSTHLLERAQINLTSLDKDAQRLERVRDNFTRLNLSAQLCCGDATQPETWWDGKPFERILADVPCSASGVVRRHPDIKWLRRPQDIANLARQQSAILASLWRLLARDGKLLYATCSVFAQENQGVINEFLQRHPDARQLPTVGVEEGQLLPNDRHDGFFYALLHKPA
jgi:16S rRNA (cytosine967-C5)-methyltransferase